MQDFGTIFGTVTTESRPLKDALKCLVLGWLGSAAAGAGMRKRFLDEGVATFIFGLFLFSSAGLCDVPRCEMKRKGEIMGEAAHQEPDSSFP